MPLIAEPHHFLVRNISEQEDVNSIVNSAFAVFVDGIDRFTIKQCFCFHAAITL